MLTWAILVGVAGMMVAEMAFSQTSSAAFLPASARDATMPERAATTRDVSAQCKRPLSSCTGEYLALACAVPLLAQSTLS